MVKNLDLSMDFVHKEFYSQQGYKDQLLFLGRELDSTFVVGLNLNLLDFLQSTLDHSDHVFVLKDP